MVRRAASRPGRDPRLGHAGARPPALIVDDHAPEGEPADGQLLLSGFGEGRETTTAALVRRLVLEQPAWLAAVGAVGHRVPECAGAPRTTVRNLVPLVNAKRLARSLPFGRPWDAARAEGSTRSRSVLGVRATRARRRRGSSRT